ncbi:MAG: hypothetical protein B7Y36_08170 [Novosphingobium sp. 28-62-57]|uniref:hypothetical protein n=1 Tax=unclassified Novosphingobium TaxID=2644732 RepID=UPI000BD3B9A4|nr:MULTISPECIES: hypothetical protein [unclassified Novosphingobium]OYW47900.1 MAG: hypothetical protein B7Z36_01265 [Novosphingobium sp. 12-63-9]OYZ10791.1 MAG: hypothetical protein B7Y36_08170 [Novosphingobium sp. 28-62-57]OZA31204.1 MAG: hypothetical protein B7X92_15105 [Novosphingobium sp. 17-62-9]HQS70900.1 hypothetical protein [Novosphingobium sp.]
MSGLRSTLIAAAVALVLALLLLGQCQKARTAGAEADLSAKTGKAQGQAGADAVNAAGAASERQSETDKITRENDAKIRSAAGADQPVDPAVGDAGRMGLCRRAAYRGKPECMRFTPAQGVAGSGAGRAPAPDG